MWSAEDKYRCARRELALRIRVYARRVAEGKMTQEDSGREIAIMSAIATDYQLLAERESVEQQLDLSAHDCPR
jgi:hypothetical protein